MVKTVNYWIPFYPPTGIDDATLEKGLALAKENGCRFVAFVDNEAFNRDLRGHIKPYIVAVAKSS